MRHLTCIPGTGLQAFSRGITALLVVIASLSVDAAIRLPVIFQSNMVLQRDKEALIWGYGDAGEQVTLLFRGMEFRAVTGTDGHWMVRLPAQPAGGPFDMVIRGGSAVIELKNLLFGDVWICGGQSNMQFSLNDIGYLPADTSAIARSAIRIFTVPAGMDYVPHEDLSGGEWRVAGAAAISDFSATAWFFGKLLYDSLRVPVGLISDNLFATALETWMSRGGLSQFPQFRTFIQDYLIPEQSAEEISSAFEKIKPEWEKKYYLRGNGMEEQWYMPETDISDWKTMNIPAWWEEQGLPDFDGAVWFRRHFDLPADFRGDTLLLKLSQVDDYDIAWINGEKVGEGYGNRTWRTYKVPARILQPKSNILVVRVFDAGGRGGMYTHAIWGDQILVGQWFYKQDVKIDAATFPRPKVVNMSMFSTPAVMYNANIAPLTSLSVKGFIWYQGESNVSRAAEYRELFPAFIRDWRAQFSQDDLPFLFVQLANYLNEVPEPAGSEWAELREAQAAALTLPNTGMAVTIDIGESSDIHPKNKMDVGKRLGLAALKVAYHMDVVSQGPAYESAEVQGDRVIVHFDRKTGPLVTKDKYGYVRGFAVAGSDRKFHWGKAYIDNGDVIVTSEKVKDPVAVRYAWSDNPGAADLYNRDGLPAAPFRTDNWPLSTAGRVFSDNPWEKK